MRLPVLLLVLLLPFPGVAETFEPKFGCMTTYWDEGAEPAAAAPPEGFAEALVFEALDVTGGVCGWAVKAWGRDDPLYVAVVDQVEFLSVGVFERDESIRLRARGRLLQRRIGHGSEPRFHRFDFAPYRIRPNEHAIGIRMANVVTYAGGGGQCQSVALLRLQEDRLDLALYTQTDYSAMVRGDPIEPGGPSAMHDVAATATLFVSEEQTDGFFDYVKSSRFSNDLEDRAASTAAYAWNGERYAPRGEVEPLEQNCLVPDFDLDPETGVETFPQWISY